MSYRVTFLTQAQQDMDDIEEYLSRFYSNTVKHFFTKLKKHISMLESMPYIVYAGVKGSKADILACP